MRSTLKCDIIFSSYWGIMSMKTKIVYISGNEVFDIADIRAAFNEVRDALGLDSQTVLFGVPVDKDDALGTQTSDSMTEYHTDVQVNNDIDINSEIPLSTETNDVNVIQPEEKIQETKAKKNVKKKTTKDTKTTETEIKADAPETKTDADNAEQAEKVIPILSVLSTKTNVTPQDSQNTYTEDIQNKTEETTNDDKASESVTTDIDIQTEELEVSINNTEAEPVQEQTADIEDMLADDAPSEPIEKTLEQLLESMTPLREDITEEHDTTIINDDIDFVPEEDTKSEQSDSDATLEQLATEFAENEDKITTNMKTENHSKIGKLKNILPFKKAKREDAGLMGDLFGWAGIAANDDDFAMPGFFTNAASKK